MTSTTSNATDGRTVGPDSGPVVSPELLGVNAVAALLGGCSKRHIYRLADASLMPRPIKLGSLVRWRRSELVNWIDGGCQPVRPAVGGGR